MIARRILSQNFKELSLAVKTLKFSTESSKAMTELQSAISSLREEKRLRQFSGSFLSNLSLDVTF
jgi:cell division GTPase FtsZ